MSKEGVVIPGQDQWGAWQEVMGSVGEGQNSEGLSSHQCAI